MRTNWSLPLPGGKPPLENVFPPARGQRPELRVLQLSDIHIDQFYAVGSEIDCTEHQCCRLGVPSANQTDGENERQFDAQRRGGRDTRDKTRAVLPINRAAGYWGAVANCDSPVWAFESALLHAKRTYGNFSYIMVSGDLDAHAGQCGNDLGLISISLRMDICEWRIMIANTLEN